MALRWLCYSLLWVVVSGTDTLVAQTFIRGDADGSQTSDLDDASYLRDYLYSNGPAPLVEAAGDANDNGAIELSDIIRIIDFDALGGAPFPAPFPTVGSDPTVDPFDPPTDLAHALEVVSGVAFLGEQGVEIPVRLHNGAAVQGVEVAISYDAQTLSMQSWDLTHSILPGAGAEYIAYDFANDPYDAHAWLAVLMDSDAPFTGHTLPPGGSQVLGTLIVDVDSAGYRPQQTKLFLRDLDLTPPKRNLVVVQGEARRPNLVAGSLDIFVPFIRGDANRDESVDISDVIAVLGYVFANGVAPPCREAADANNDEGIDIADGVYLLTYLFNAGPAPAAPYPLPGIDGDSDPLPCLGWEPVLDLWYGDYQRVGGISLTQPWVDVVGSLGDPDAVSSFTYRLNGGPPIPITVGPDSRRLAGAGDFVIDLPIASLLEGSNQVLFNADGFTRPVEIFYTSGIVGSLPLTVDWGDLHRIDEVAHVVDGDWELRDGVVKVRAPGYDRLIALGDIAWTDYEITAELTIHGIDPVYVGPSSPGPLVGFLMRWQGHSVTGTQPHWGFLPLGMLGCYQYRSDGSQTLEMRGDSGVVSQDSSGLTLDFDTTYYLKMRVQSTPSSGGQYWLKAWPVGQLEPGAWTVQGVGGAGDLVSGSVLLVAHHVDASFGPVTIIPLP